MLRHDWLRCLTNTREFPDVFSDPQMKGDPLHPNAAGHAQLSQNIFDALKSIGYAAE